MKTNLLFATLVFVMVILLIVEVLGLHVSYFEDGSFRIVGCLPWEICV